MNNNMIKVVNPYTNECFEMTPEQIEAAYRYQQRMYLSEDFKTIIDDYRVNGDIDDDIYHRLMNNLDDLVECFEYGTDSNMTHNEMLMAVINNYI